MFILCGDILLDKDGGCERDGEKNRTEDKGGTQSLSTCSKTQCMLLKTAKGGIFSRECAESRLQGIRDREMKARGEWRKWGWGVWRRPSPGEPPDTDRIPTGQDAPESEPNISTLFETTPRVVGGGCSCRQLFSNQASGNNWQPNISEHPNKRRLRTHKGC